MRLWNELTTWGRVSTAFWLVTGTLVWISEWFGWIDGQTSTHWIAIAAFFVASNYVLLTRGDG